MLNNSAQGLEDILQDSPEKTQGETTSDFDIAKLLADDNNSQPLFPSVAELNASADSDLNEVDMDTEDPVSSTIPDFHTIAGFQDDLGLEQNTFTLSGSRKRKRDETQSGTLEGPTPPQAPRFRLDKEQVPRYGILSLQRNSVSPAGLSGFSPDATAVFSPETGVHRIEHPLNLQVPEILVRSFRDGLHQLEWKDSVNEMVLVNVSKELHAMAKRLSTPEDPNETDANVLKQMKALLKLKEEDQMAFTHLTRKIKKVMGGSKVEAVTLPLLIKGNESLSSEIASLEAGKRGNEYSLKQAEEKLEKLQQKERSRVELIKKIKAHADKQKDTLRKQNEMEMKKKELEKKISERKQTSEMRAKERNEMIRARMKKWKKEIEVTQVQFMYKGKDIIVYKVMGRVYIKFHFQGGKYQRLEWKYLRPDDKGPMFDFSMAFLLSYFENFQRFYSKIQTRDEIPLVIESIRTHVQRVRTFRDYELMPLFTSDGTSVLPLVPLPEIDKSDKAAKLAEKYKSFGDIVFQLIIKNKRKATHLIVGLLRGYPEVKPNILCEQFTRVGKAQQDAVKNAIETSKAWPKFLINLSKQVKELMD